MPNAVHDRASGIFTVPPDPLLLQSPFGTQAVIFKEVFADDCILLDSGEAEWLRAVLAVEWRPLRPVAAKYYQGLWEFNIEAARKRGLRVRVEAAVGESREDATQRLMFERAQSQESGRVIRRV